MNKDEYGEIINGVETYRDIVHYLKTNGSIIIGWTDEEFTHYDILFSCNVIKIKGNELQRGLRWTDLFVSIIGVGAMGFITDEEKSPAYVGEKLNLNVNYTTIKLTELINGIIKEARRVK